MTSLAATQKTRAVHLYRHALKTCLSWAVNRDLWYTELDRIRREFDSHKGESNPVVVDRLILNGEGALAKYRHPDPYTIPYSYGGSKYARNPPVPGEVHVVMDFAREGAH